MKLFPANSWYSSVYLLLIDSYVFFSGLMNGALHETIYVTTCLRKPNTNFQNTSNLLLLLVISYAPDAKPPDPLQNCYETCSLLDWNVLTYYPLDVSTVFLYLFSSYRVICLLCAIDTENMIQNKVSALIWVASIRIDVFFFAPLKSMTEKRWETRERVREENTN